MSSRFRTIQDRIADHSALDALARLNAEVELRLYLEMRKGRVFTGDLAKTFYQQFGISAKNLDHIHAALKGRMDGMSECANLHVEQLTDKIAAKGRDIARRDRSLAKTVMAIDREAGRRRPDQALLASLRGGRDKMRSALHQHRRRLAVLEHRLEEARGRHDDVTVCFGSRRRLRERALIDAEDADSIAAWRAEWERARSGEVFVPGDASVSCGNLFVKLVATEGGWDVVLRLPRALKDLATRHSRAGGQDIHEAVVGYVSFPHGADALSAALDQADKPVTWRIQRHERGGWLVSCTFQDALPDMVVSNFADGALGVDFNAGFLSLSLTDGNGVWLRSWRLPLVTHSRSSEQNLDTCRKAALEIVRAALKHGVPVVAESLDFARKKASVTTEQGPRYARMLNGLAYGLFAQALTSACVRNGILLKRVNPAYTSIIGCANVARQHGLDDHSAAAVAIARRGQGFSERVPAQVRVSLAAGVHGTLPRPDRIARRHVWASWVGVARRRRAALTAQLRSLRERRSVESSERGRKAAGAGSG